MTEGSVRTPAVAGAFYPADPAALRQRVRAYLDEAVEPDVPCPRAVIAPHAGYVYSGPIAATAYRLIRRCATNYRRVVLVGPSHRVPFQGLALTGAASYRTPLGDVPVDRALCERLAAHPAVQTLDAAHEPEHSLEVQVPFLQTALDDFTLAPVVTGFIDAETAAEALAPAADQPDTLIVISSDLSHYHEYDEARFMDEQASRSILALDPSGLADESACGRVGIGALLLLAQRYRWKAHLLDLRSSGDTAGPRSEVVGYGAYAFTSAEPST